MPLPCSSTTTLLYSLELCFYTISQEETEEAVQAGNRKYNDMLAERMKMEDELRDKIQVAKKG